MYFDQVRRYADSTATTFIMEIDFTATVNSVVSNFGFRKGDAMVLRIQIANSYFWNNIVSCQLLGGIISTDN
jgi:hypothetical protein